MDMSALPFYIISCGNVTKLNWLSINGIEILNIASTLIVIYSGKEGLVHYMTTRIVVLLMSMPFTDFVVSLAM